MPSASPGPEPSEPTGLPAPMLALLLLLGLAGAGLLGYAVWRARGQGGPADDATDDGTAPTVDRDGPADDGGDTPV